MFKIRDHRDPIVMKEQYHYRTNRSSKRVNKKDSLRTSRSRASSSRASKASSRVSSAQKLAEVRRNAIDQTQSRTKASASRGRASASRVSSAQKLAEVRRNAISQTQSRTRASASRVTPQIKIIRKTKPITMFSFGKETPSQRAMRLAKQRRS